ncbi:hypothetical protein [Hoeflea prorocentri]|uniref:F5/8 type C domain-containing protein n=1 Tax=Hoeflea prorocentri TaxID=1922333 RepID=A0A9X3ZH68_9HYPH|nr:hypothetical protein [Hoeflea prorocentri]MCY6380969.1 hypothetical protein [Hoeflea prorocentri]MDA5398769.1 hypothetical protein [Hoeflea prorocentri]
MTVYPIQATFTRGELAPELHGRVDIDHYRMGLARCENFYVLKQGGIRRRSGTVFVAEVKNSNDACRLFPFAFNESQAYAIEHGNGYCRFFALDGQVFNGGAPYEIPSPFALNDLDAIDYTQSADVLYMTHGSYAPRELRRASETSWAFSQYDFQDGPYLSENTTSTTLTPAETGHITPQMTGAATPSGTVTSGGGTQPYRIFNRDKSENITIDGGSHGFVQYQFPGGTRKVADAYWITSSSNAAQHGDYFTQWEFQGSNDGTNWVTLDSRDGETGWSGSETRYYEFDNDVAYEHYRLNFSGGGGADGVNTNVAELAIHQKASDQTPFDLTASSTAGINDGTGFQTSDVGRLIRLLGGDGVWRWAEITGRTSTTIVKIRLHGQALPDTSPIVTWALGAWSHESGWPHSVGFYQERLAFGRTYAQPRTVWLSKSLQFNSFGESEPVIASDGMSITMTGGHLNAISFIREGGDLVIGTSGSMRTLGPASTAEAFSSTNIQQRQQTTTGAAPIRPVTVGNTIIYGGFHKSALHEFSFSFDVNGYLSPELTVLSSHAFKAGISFLAYQEFPDGIIWCGLDDGTLTATTYDKAQKVVGISRHRIAGGQAGKTGTVESACIVPVENGDRLWMIVRRTINGQTRRFVEYLEMPFDGADVSEGIFLDCAVTIDSGGPVTTVNGAGHLEGLTIGVFADGVDLGDAVVSGGVFSLPGGIEASRITYGLRYESYAETLRMAQTGNRDGASIGRRARLVSVALDLMETGYIKAGSKARQFDYLFRRTDENLGSERELHTGFKTLSSEDHWSNGGVVVLRSDRAYPATIRSIVASVEGEP